MIAVYSSFGDIYVCIAQHVTAHVTPCVTDSICSFSEGAALLALRADRLVFAGGGFARPFRRADQLMFVPFVFAGMLPRKRGTEGAHGDGNEEGATSTHRGHAGRRSKRLDMETEGQREARLRRMRQNRARQLASETEGQA